MDLFSPLTIRDITFRNRIAVSPMCQYSCTNGLANTWHLVHLGSRAVGGAALVVVEATAVEARGRISPGDMGIWSEEHIAAFQPITKFLKEQGAVPGIQLAHAGRKASTNVPWSHRGAQIALEEGGWKTVAPSAIPFNEADRSPVAMTKEDIQSVTNAFQAAAQRALASGFEVVEIHAAHGYLLHEFLSPLSNHRTDEYGGSVENRMRLAKEVVRAVRHSWPDRLPLFLRISASDWVSNGWSEDDSVALAKAVKPLGVDLIDCSSGGNVPKAQIPVGPSYQVPFAERVKAEAEILTGAVGMITDPAQADEIIKSNKADLVFLAREFLRNPYWPILAAKKLGQTLAVPVQYGRAF